MNRPDVSVAIPVYNGAQFLPEAIASILGQTYRHLELILVDDGSTDASADIIRSASCRDARVVPIFLPHRGIASAMNAALVKARGRYFAVIDQDDIALPERLARQIAYLESHPEIAVVGTAWETFGATSKTIIPPTSPDDVAAAMDRWCAVLHPSSTMRTAMVRSLGGYRTVLPYGSDSDLWLRVLERAKMANIPEILLRKRKHAAQATCSNDDRQARTALSGIIYMSHLSRKHFGDDFITDRETLVEDAVRFFHRFLRETTVRNPAIFHHLNRFVRYVPLKPIDEARSPPHPYLTYLRELASLGTPRLTIRGAYYVLEFFLFNRFSWAANRRFLSGRQSAHERLYEEGPELRRPAFVPADANEPSKAALA